MSSELKKSIIEWSLILSFFVVGYAAWILTPDWDHRPNEAEARSTSEGERLSGRPIKLQR